MKRVVTAIGADGKSHIERADEPTRILRLDRLPGLEFAEIWATDAPFTPSTPCDDITTTMQSLVPTAHGTRFRIVTLPPDHTVLSALSQPETALELLGDLRKQAPGIGDAGDPHDPAMHVTPTLDYGIVLSGEVTLEMDSGESVLMRCGDCIVQQGTKHAWRNRTEKPVVIAFVMVGAASAPV